MPQSLRAPRRTFQNAAESSGASQNARRASEPSNASPTTPARPRIFGQLAELFDALQNPPAAHGSLQPALEPSNVSPNPPMRRRIFKRLPERSVCRRIFRRLTEALSVLPNLPACRRIFNRLTELSGVLPNLRASTPNLPARGRSFCVSPKLPARARAFCASLEPSGARPSFLCLVGTFESVPELSVSRWNLPARARAFCVSLLSLQSLGSFSMSRLSNPP